jgi:hypothetical protein
MIEYRHEYVDVFLALNDVMDYRERIYNLFALHIYRHMAHQIVREQNSRFRQHYGHSFPCLSQLAQQTSLIIVNVDDMLTFPQPISRNIIYVASSAIGNNNNNNNRHQLTPVIFI